MLGSSRLGLLCLIVCQSFPSAVALRQRECERSGLCSYGFLSRKTFVGDIRAGLAFRKALKAVSYKREVIIVSTDDIVGLHLLLALNLYQEARYHGYGHLAMLVTNPKSCDLMLQYEPGISCMWDSLLSGNLKEGPHLQPIAQLYTNRLRFLVRAARLRYNTLSLDGDMFLLSDPYIHLKSGPLGQYQFLCPREGGPLTCNGGVMYLHNARVDGPVTWMMQEAAALPFKMFDALGETNQNSAFRLERCLNRWTPDDQDSVMASLQAAAMGQLLFPGFSSRCCNHQFQAEVDGERISCYNAERNIARLVHQCGQVELLKMLPSKEAPLFESKGYTMHMLNTWVANLTIPNAAWPPSNYYGGRLFSSSVGPATQRIYDQLKEDCPKCPWWREIWPVTQNISAKAMLGDKGLCRIPTQNQAPEQYAAPPLWFAHSAAQFRHGYHAAPRAMVNKLEVAVIKHVHGWHLMEPGLQQKLNPRKVFGRYNWTLAEMVAHKTHSSPYSSNRTIEQVLAFSPDIDLTRVRTWTEFSHILAGFIQVALLSNRAPLMPDVPCESAWLHQDSSIHRACVPPIFPQEHSRLPNGIPYPVDDFNVISGGWLAGFNEAIPDLNQTFTGPQRYMVALPFLYDLRCTQALHGVTLPEFHHWVSKRRERGESEPKEASPFNSVFRLPSSLSGSTGDIGARSRRWPTGELHLPDEAKGWSLRDDQVSLSVSIVLKEMDRLKDEAVVFFGHPVEVIASTGTAHDTEANDALDSVNAKIQSSNCKGTKVHPEDVGLHKDLFDKSPSVKFGGARRGYLNAQHELVVMRRDRGMGFW